jgi:UDP-N-acetylglucosamine:LPS N-acetylglucosamine transferase
VKVLVATGALGEGHDAAARAVTEAFRAAYSGCATRTVETMSLMGRTVASGTRWSYVLGVGPFGACYQLFFDAVWRFRWFAEAIVRFVGRRAGPALERQIVACAPDLVVSTFPMASAGFAWLRRRGRLPVPALAVVPDFAPHPFWVLPELDLHLVSHTVCLADVARVSASASAKVSTAPVARRFTPAPEASPRKEVRLLATFGGLGLGRVEALVRAASEAHPRVRLVVVCGRNERLRRRLARLDRGDGRLDVRGWVDDMPAVLRSVDVVINNAGGASALEALACGLPTLLADPVPGHGRANARRMEEAGLATVCPTPADLAREVRRLAVDGAYRERLRRDAARYAADRDLAADLRHAVDPLLAESATRASSGPS